MSDWMLVGMVVSVVLGAATQRITGIGFALVSAPMLVLVSGPVSGVLLANVLTLITNLVVLTETWRQVDLRRVLLLAIPALCMQPVGYFIARQLPPATLMVGIGTLVLAALAGVRLLRRAGLFSGVGGAIAAGGLSGFMNVTAGIGGPAVTLYAIGARWPHRSFIGTMQAYFAVLNLGSIITKGLPHIGTTAFLAVLGGLAVGLVVGHFAASRIAPERARTAVLVLAVAGAVGTILKGLGG
jgi:uncharacterized protein